jgi:hypothetical protein
VKCNGRELWNNNEEVRCGAGMSCLQYSYSIITPEKIKKKKRNNSILTSVLILIQKRLLFKYCA